MILSGKEILKHIGKEIQIAPFDENRLNPNRGGSSVGTT